MSTRLPYRKAARNSLSTIEERIITELADGSRPAEIADGLDISEHAIAVRITRLRERLKAKTVAHMVAMYVSGKIQGVSAELAGRTA